MPGGLEAVGQAIAGAPGVLVEFVGELNGGDLDDAGPTPPARHQAGEKAFDGLSAGREMQEPLARCCLVSSS